MTLRYTLQSDAPRGPLERLTSKYRLNRAGGPRATFVFFVIVFAPRATAIGPRTSQSDAPKWLLFGGKEATEGLQKPHQPSTAKIVLSDAPSDSDAKKIGGETVRF